MSYVTLSWHYLALRSILDELARLSLEFEIDGIGIVELGVGVSMLIHTNVVVSCACQPVSSTNTRSQASRISSVDPSRTVLIASGLLLLPSLPSRSMQQIMTSCRVCGSRFWRLGGAQTSDETNIILICTPASMATTSPSLGRRFCKIDLDRVPRENSHAALMLPWYIAFSPYLPQCAGRVLNFGLIVSTIQCYAL